MLVDQYIGFFKFICTYLLHVEVKRISRKIQKISADKMQKTGTCTCKNCTCTCIRTRCRSKCPCWIPVISLKTDKVQKSRFYKTSMTLWTTNSTRWGAIPLSLLKDISIVYLNILWRNLKLLLNKYR